MRASFFAGERFVDREDAQRRAEEWCRTKAGLRVHGTTQCRPAELFALERPAYPAPGFETARVTGPILDAGRISLAEGWGRPAGSYRLSGDLCCLPYVPPFPVQIEVGDLE